MDEFLCAIEQHPKACTFLVLLAILTCTFRIQWYIGKDNSEVVDNQKDNEG